MSDQKIIDTPDNWDSASSGYAEKVAPFLMEIFAEDFTERLDVNDMTEAIEVAAGSGALTTTLAKKVKSLLATDFSPKMLEILKTKIKKNGLENVTFALMDGQSLEVTDQKMDRAVCSFGLMLFPDRHKGFKELQRILRPGGKALVSGWAGPEKFEAIGLFLEAINSVFPDMPKPDAPPPVFTLSDLDRFKTEMEAAGFKDVKTSFIEKSLRVNNFSEMWGMLTVGAPPIKMLFDKIGEENADKVHDALQNIVEKRFGGGEIIISNTATVGVGTAT